MIRPNPRHPRARPQGLPLRSRLCRLHLRLDRPAQGRRSRLFRHAEPPQLDVAHLSLPVRRGWGAEHADQLRGFPVGSMGATAGRCTGARHPDSRPHRPPCPDRPPRPAQGHPPLARPLDAQRHGGGRPRPRRAPPQPRHVGGERRGADAAAGGALHAAAPSATLYNLYGISEVWDATWQPCVPGASIVPIGKPIDNVRCHVLDRRLHEVPVGLPGELCIGAPDSPASILAMRN